jgi:hypothetical protein
MVMSKVETPAVNAPATPPAKENANPTPPPAAAEKVASEKAPAAEPQKAAAETKVETPAASAEPAKEPAKEPTKVDPPKPPEKYEFKTRKDSPLLKSDVEEIEAAAKAQGLSQEQAQKIVESREADFDRVHDRQKQFLKSRNDEWVKAAAADPEIAGKDGKMLKENVELAHRGLKMMFGEKINPWLVESGAGNHPDIIKGFMRFGKMFQDDKAILDGRVSSPDKKPALADRMYPSHGKQKSKEKSKES